MDALSEVLWTVGLVLIHGRVEASARFGNGRGSASDVGWIERESG